jgi:RimJ/RimL family protein N-acetyltransferase
MIPLPHEVSPVGQAADLAAATRGMLPLIETARTRLRVPVLADLPAWYAILCTDRAQYMDGPLSRDDAFREFAANVGSWLLRGFGGCTVVDRKSGDVLGFACLNMEPGDHEPELGYFCLPMAEGKGLMSEAAGALRDWALAQDLPSLVSYVDPQNPRSGALAARIGAVRDAVAEAAFDGTTGAGVQVWRHYPKGAT